MKEALLGLEEDLLGIGGFSRAETEVNLQEDPREWVDEIVSHAGRRVRYRNTFSRNCRSIGE